MGNRTVIMTKEEIRKAREFYGIYGYVNDSMVVRLCECVREHGIEWTKVNIDILTKLSYKPW